MNGCRVCMQASKNVVKSLLLKIYKFTEEKKNPFLFMDLANLVNSYILYSP